VPRPVPRARRPSPQTVVDDGPSISTYAMGQAGPPDAPPVQHPVQRLELPRDDRPVSCAWDATGSVLAAVCERSVRAWAMRRGRLEPAAGAPLPYRGTAVAVLGAAQGGGGAPGRLLLAVGGALGCRCYSLPASGAGPDPARPHAFPEPTAALLSGLPVAAVGASPCGGLLAAVTAEGVAEVWAVGDVAPDGRCGGGWAPLSSDYLDLGRPAVRPTGVSFSPDSRAVAVAHANGDVRVLARAADAAGPARAWDAVPLSELHLLRPARGPAAAGGGAGSRGTFAGPARFRTGEGSAALPPAPPGAAPPGAGFAETWVIRQPCCAGEDADTGGGATCKECMKLSGITGGASHVCWGWSGGDGGGDDGGGGGGGGGPRGGPGGGGGGASAPQGG